MHIRQQQEEELMKANRKDFVQSTLIFLKSAFDDFCADKKEEELISLIEHELKEAGDAGVHAGINIQRLLHYAIKLPAPTVSFLEWVASQPHPENEFVLIDDWFFYLLSRKNPRTLIPIARHDRLYR